MPAKLADTLSFLGSTELALGRVAEAEAALRESVRLAEVAAGPDRRPALMARAALATLLFKRGQLAEALALYERVRADYLRLPVGRRGTDAVASVVSYEASARLQFGHVGEALQLIEEALAGPDGSSVPAQYRTALLNQRALIWIDAGQAARAERALAEAEQVIAAEQLQATPVAAAVQLARSRWLLLLGRTGEARRLLEQVVRELDQAELAQASHPADLTLAARIDIARQRWDPAAQWAERALARTPERGLKTSFDSAAAWHALGVAELGAGRVDDARRALERAVAQFEGMVDTARSPHLARALADLARAQQQAGRGREARSLEQRSRRILATS